MDVDLEKEIRDIMDLKDQEIVVAKTAKLIRFILVGVNSTDGNDLIVKFAKHAFSVLPSSNLPRTLAKKFGLQIDRTKRVTFGGTTQNVFDYPLSEEARLQEERESSSLSLANVDLNLKFKPTYSLKEAKRTETRIVGLYEGIEGNTVTVDDLQRDAIAVGGIGRAMTSNTVAVDDKETKESDLVGDTERNLNEKRLCSLNEKRLCSLNVTILDLIRDDNLLQKYF